MGRMKTNESKVSVAQSQSVSLRTTIPSNIAEQLGLNAGDTLRWKTDKVEGNWIAVIVKRNGDTA